MQPVNIPKKRAHALSNGIFLVFVAIMVFTNLWWPWIILAIGITLATRQYLTGRIYYSALTTVIAGLLFFMEFFRFGWNEYIPVLLLIAGIFIIVREVWFTRDTNGEDKAEEIAEDADI